ncbi:GrpB family protein [Oceanobacillus jeddahense]|uniref:GrpB family protein n=1 Tax=Oceanobacillus jeddahense TaxID=1462527 RepID=A0ABY5JX24_9BACI|nr:GrpB family protein [Oceanobacillus jeddahense]UUI04621.1 GrpB family protein [Oceanobacillus jeddahense]
MEKKIEIVAYRPEWEETFLELKNVLYQQIGDIVLAIEHVGSTSIKKLAAKPILDIDIVIDSYQDFSKITERLQELGYFHEGDLGIEKREVFGRRDSYVPWSEGNRSWMEHHLYVCPKDSEELSRHLAFRDYLRKHPETAEKYQCIKKDLAKTVNSREAYTMGKTGFIEKVMERAMKEKK